MKLRWAWEAEADRWIAWAREPGFDSYWRFHRRQLLGLVPAPRRLTLDVGCGEGRVARDLSVLGHRVVGVDPVRTLAHAAAHNQGVVVAQGDGARLPLWDGAVDLVVAFMSPQDVDDLAGLMTEAYRVLEPGGRFYVAVVHPINSSGHFDRPEKPATFSFGAPYLAERFIDDEVEQDGLTMRFVSLHRPLDRYSRCLEGAGFVIETMRELTEPDPASRWYDVPLFLHLVAVKPPLTARLDRRIFHITTGSEADRLMAEGALEPPSLAAEGFVHCSTAAQVVDTTARYYAPEAEVVLLELDPELVESDIAWPEVYPGLGPGLGQRFPHVHGPLTRAAVRRRHPWGPGDRRQWPISESG